MLHIWAEAGLKHNNAMTAHTSDSVVRMTDQKDRPD